MSLFGGGADCSAGANPLMQLNKASGQDSALQASLRQGQGQRNGPQQQQMHNQMNAINRQQHDAFMNNQMNSPAFDFKPLQHEIHQMAHTPSAPQQHSNWSQEFIQQQPLQQVQAQPQLQGSSHSLQSLNTAAGPQLQQQQFRQNMMMRNPMVGQMTNHHMMHMMQSRQSQQNLQQQSNVQQQQQQQASDLSSDWESQFRSIENDLLQNATAEQMDESVNIVNEMNETFEASEDYMRLFANRPHEHYSFETANEFLHNPNAYEIGCRLMEGGAKLSEAAMAFEAAVQEDPKHVDAWLKLGQCQIQNEKELQGITALENCLHNDPNNLTALMNLAISYVNEGYDTAAFRSFEKWIETKYPDVVSKARQEDSSTSDDRYSLNKRVTNLFIKAAQLSPSGANMDADVQTGLGVLFYSMEEYDKTLDCFQAAIRCDPNDALLWNRLGASYANSNRPEQAIESYSRALQLNPNFVRARYNLGVSFINMGMYRDAVDQLLTGLSMHEVESPDGDGSFVSDTDQSGSLIETLKRALLAMDRRDIIDKVKPGMNVQQFRSAHSF